MGLFRSTDISKAPAGTETTFYSDGTAQVTWFGDPALLMRTPAVYLDLALNKDRKDDEIALLGVVNEFTHGTFEDAATS